MSLEQALADNTAAMKELTAALKGAKGGGSKADAAIEAEAARAAGAKGGAGKAAGAKGPTIDTIKARFGEFLGAEDPKVRKARIAQVQAMMAHFGVAKATELEKSDWAKALAYLDQLESGETPDYAEDDDNGGDDDDALI